MQWCGEEQLDIHEFMNLGGIVSPASSAAGSISGFSVFHNNIQILMGTSNTKLVDVTAGFPPMSMISIHYEDPISFQADTLEVTFADIGDQIIKSGSLIAAGDVQLKKGNWIKVKIDQWNRDYMGSHVQRDLGTFQIDQIKTRWPPSQVTIMASSLPISSQAKLTLQNKTRFAVTLAQLTQQVAQENGYAFKWDVGSTSPAGSRANVRVMSTASQWNESDLSMLSRYLRENGLSMKIKDIGGKQTLVVFDEQDLEQKPPVYTIDFSQPGAGIALEHGELTTQSQDIYAGSQLAYYDSNSNQVYYGVADAPPDTADGSKDKLKVTDVRHASVGGAGEEKAVKGD